MTRTVTPLEEPKWGLAETLERSFSREKQARWFRSQPLECLRVLQVTGDRKVILDAVIRRKEKEDTAYSCDKPTRPTKCTCVLVGPVTSCGNQAYYGLELCEYCKSYKQADMM